MIRYILGPVLMGTGYIAGSIYGRDAEQLIHKSPSDTYAAVEATFDNMRPSGTTSFEGGTPMAYEIKVDHALDQSLQLHLFFNGQEGATAEFDFAPQNDGKETLVTVHMHGDHKVLRSALAGTDKARLAYAPDWMLNLAAKPLLQQLALQIEQGEISPFAGMSEGEAEAQWENNLTDEQKNNVAEWRQYDATRPAVDPNADAQNYIGGSSN